MLDPSIAQALMEQQGQIGGGGAAPLQGMLDDEKSKRRSQLIGAMLGGVGGQAVNNAGPGMSGLANAGMGGLASALGNYLMMSNMGGK